MEEEVEMKTRKLRKLMTRYQQSKNELSALRTELQDTIHEFQRERADMFLSLRSLDQQLQLKNFLIDKFIPPEELNKVMRRVHWDEENETWNLVQNTVPLRSVPYSGPTRISIDGFTKQPLLRPNSAIGRSRPPLRQPEQPLSQSERDRYLVDNILKMDLEMSEGRNPFEFDKSSRTSNNDAEVEHALRELRADEDPYFSYESNSVPPQPAPALAGARPKSARTKHHRHTRPQSASR
jgi:kinesin family protein 3/17